MASKITQYKLEATGNTTAYTSNVVRGKILALIVNYNASPATTDVTISDTNAAIAQTIYTKDDSQTDAWVYPRAYAQDTAGTDLTYDATRKIPVPFTVFSRLKLVVTGNDTDDVVTVHVLVEEY